MPRSSNYTKRNSVGVNVLSDSEAEDVSVEDKVKKRRSVKSGSTAGKSASLISNNHSNHTSATYSSIDHSYNGLKTSQSINASNYSTVSQTPTRSFSHTSEFNHTSGSNACLSNISSPVIDISTVQYTPIDRFRWFLWSNIYLKIIRCFYFDVWLLSRLQKYRRLIAMLILLPFLAYLLYSGFPDNDSRSSHISSLNSNVISLFSSIFSHSSSSSSEGNTIESSAAESGSGSKFKDIIYTIYLAILNFFSSIFVRTHENVPHSSKSSQTVIETKSATNREDLKLIVVEVFEEKLDEILKIATESQILHSKQIKKEDNVEIQSEIKKLRLGFQSLTESVKQFEKDVSLKSEQSFLKYGKKLEDYNHHINLINEKIKNFDEKLLVLSGDLKTCCSEKWTISDFTDSFERHFLEVLKQMVNGETDRNSQYYFFVEWLHSKVAHDREKLSQELKFEFSKSKSSEVKFDDKFQATVESVVKQHMESFKKDITSFNKVEVTSSDEFSYDVVKTLIKQAILLYDADKTGRVDYALESGGGSVLSTRCSENYAEKDGTISVLGFSLWSTHNSPRTAIQPNMQPGECWAFKGSQGFLVVQLAYTIHPTGFTLEHIPVYLSPSGSIDSAPKDFSVWGLLSEKDNEGLLLGKYSYNQEGEPLQYYAVQNTYTEPFSYVELKIHSNYGNLDYTCLYRFRVHGNRPKH